MKLEVLLFGILADLIGEHSITIELTERNSVADFKANLKNSFPQLKSYTTYVVAVNENYATDTLILKENDTIALIPPVSGG